jgi:hypothetical protein
VEDKEKDRDSGCRKKRANSLQQTADSEEVKKRRASGFR